MSVANQDVGIMVEHLGRCLIAILLHAVVQAMANIFYYGYYTTGPAKAVMWLTPVGRIWTAIGNDTSYWITADGRVSRSARRSRPR